MLSTDLNTGSDSVDPTLALILYSMFLDQSLSASESLVEDKNFLALEIRVLDDFATVSNQQIEPSITADHLLYLEALRMRGEYLSGLDLINRILAGARSASGLSRSVLLVCKAEMLLALDREDDAEHALEEARTLPAAPKTRERIAIKLAALMTSQAQASKAVSVLEGALNSLELAERSAELVVTLAATYVQAGNIHLAEELLLEHIHPLNHTAPSPFPPLQSTICRLFLASVLLDRGRCEEADDLLTAIVESKYPVTGSLQSFARYFLAVSAAARTGLLLPDAMAPAKVALTTDFSSDAQLAVFASFEWLFNSTDDKLAGDSNISMSVPPVDPYLSALLHYDEIERQGRAYELLMGDDFAGAIAAFNNLAKLRRDKGRQDGLLAAVDSKALSIGLERAGRSEALSQARTTRRQLQLLLGLSSTGTQKAVLDEAQLLMDQGNSAEASSLIEACLLHPVGTDFGRIISLRLRLILMEVATRNGQIGESLISAHSLELEAKSLGVEHEIVPVLRYQRAAAAAAQKDFDVAEHEFESLRRDLKATYGIHHELSNKATYGLARVLQRRGQYERAVSVFESLLHQDTVIDRILSIRVRRRISECLLQLDDPAGAAQHYRDAADALSNWTDTKDPAYLNARLGQADCLLASGRYREARVIYRAVWELLHGGHTGLDMFYMRSIIGNGTCLRRMHEYSGAAFNYRRAHTLNSLVDCLNSVEAIQLEKWLAWSLEMSGELLEAAHHYRISIELLQATSPDSDMIHELHSRLKCCIR